jgi:hypothetical protein
MSTNEPRALTAALQSPAFVTRGGGLAMHVANRHVERWAPEAGANRSRPLRNLGFVDRLVAPWIESAQRSASLRMFSQYISAGPAERTAPSAASWVFPRPWYQDELDWMAAARQVAAQSAVDQSAAPTMFTTRGTYVAPVQASSVALPSMLHEYVAPSLSVSRATADAYSPLVPFAAAQAAHVMAHAIAPLARSAEPAGLRSLLSTMLARSMRNDDIVPTRTSLSAPQMVTPPAPRPATELAEQYAEQHARLADLQRTARVAAEREMATRVAETAASQARAAESRGDTAATQAVVEQQRIAAARQEMQQRLHEQAQQRVREQQRAHEQRLHEQSRDAAARDARAAVPERAPAEVVDVRAVEPSLEARPEGAAVEIAAAVAALPPELSAMVAASIGQRPERAAQAIAELGEALRSVELIARTSAAGGSIESTRGPRIVMPAGLGGLVTAVERTAVERVIGERAQQRLPMLAARAPAPQLASTSALGAAMAARPAALEHVAWSDRWLARFAGAQPQSLDLLAAAASHETRLQVLASAAPQAVFVAPKLDERTAAPSASLDEPLPTLRGGPAPAQPVLRFDDNAETPDDLFAAISMAATRSRAATPAPSAPIATTSMREPELGAARTTLADLVAHAAPAAPGAGLSAQLASSPFAAALRHVVQLGSAPSFDVRALFGEGLASTYLAGMLSTPTSELSLSAPNLDFAYVVPEQERPLTTLRSDLLASDDEPSPPATRTPFARTLIESMAMPMAGEVAALAQPGSVDVSSARAASYAAPGMIADRAHAWSVAQERSSADLSFDFVTPELVLAARVYGLGPAEAAQAARLAIAGPGQLTAMASNVDRTFVQAMAMTSERRARPATAYPVDAASGSETASSPVGAAGFGGATSFGVERRAPRGSFLWPASSTAALGLAAPSPDGDQSMSIAALELLAAQAVASLGTYTALAEQPRDEDMLASVADSVPAARREKFESLYVALSQSPSARAWSPSARAARAFALAGRGEETISARERAMVAWDVLPVVYGVTDDAGVLSTGDAAAREERRREELRAFAPTFVDGRPGLGALSSRAGEALGSYVAPSVVAAPSSSSSGSSSQAERDLGALLRAPTAAPELVQTGRSSGRFGGGEVEIPAWFEAAAKKMFEEKSSGGGLSENISLAELTLITSAPAPQIAASTREHGSQAPVVASAGAAPEAPAAVDIEKLANDVYREVLVLMDLARSRNGEPYL